MNRPHVAGLILDGAIVVLAFVGVVLFGAPWNLFAVVTAAVIGARASLKPPGDDGDGSGGSGSGTPPGVPRLGGSRGSLSDHSGAAAFSAGLLSLAGRAWRRGAHVVAALHVVVPLALGALIVFLAGCCCCESPPEERPCEWPDGWTAVLSVGGCCARVQPCGTDNDESLYRAACIAQDPEYALPIVCAAAPEDAPGQQCKPLVGDAAPVEACDLAPRVYCCREVP